MTRLFKFSEMYNYISIESKETRGFEFLKIYGIALVVAFLLLLAFQYRLTNSAGLEKVLPSPPTASVSSHSDGGLLFPFQMLKKKNVNLTF